MSAVTVNNAEQLEQDLDIVDRNIKHAGRPAVIVWFVLMLATLISWYLGDGHAGTKFAAIAVIITAFMKVALIGDHFMELRTAPPQLRWAFHGWCTLVPGIICGIYLVRA